MYWDDSGRGGIAAWEEMGRGRREMYWIMRIGSGVPCHGKDARRCHGLRVYPAGLKCVGVCVWRLGEDNLEVGDDE